MLLDTSGLLCLHHAAELQHEAATVFFDSAPTKFTHSYVLAELVALAGVRGLPRAATLAFIADLQDSPEVTDTLILRKSRGVPNPVLHFDN